MRSDVSWSENTTLFADRPWYEKLGGRKDVGSKLLIQNETLKKMNMQEPQEC